MKLSVFSIEVRRKRVLPNLLIVDEVFTCMYDGKGWLYDLRPNGMSKKTPWFSAGDTIEVDGQVQTIKFVEVIPPIPDQVIESLWEGQKLYSSSGFCGFRYGLEGIAA
jgi:hypothetical protein